MRSDNVTTSKDPHRAYIRYPEVLEMQASFFCDLSDNSILRDLPQWSERVVKGHLPHGAPALAVLIQKLMASKDRMTGLAPAPPDVPEPPPQTAAPPSEPPAAPAARRRVTRM